MGQTVIVRLNKRNTTPHRGIVSAAEWHRKNQQWNFYIEVNGKPLSRRYTEDDLQATD